jgi:hypothetical protein
MLQAPQTSYTQFPPVAFAGQRADSGEFEATSALAEVVFDCGLGLVKGTAGGPTPQVKLPTQASDVTNLFKGVSLYQAYRQPTNTANRYAVGDAVPVVETGRIWVKIDPTVGATMSDEGPVFLVHSGANAGTFRGDAGVGPSATVVAGAKCKQGGIAGGIAAVKFNIP